jgi:hypothetical protein
MPFPSGTFIDSMRASYGIVADELDAFYSLLQGWMSKEHKADGTHGALTADTITTPDATALVLHATGAIIDTLQVTGDIHGDHAISGDTLIAQTSVVSGGFVQFGFARATSGTGSPEGVVDGGRGSLYSRLDGGAGTCLYVKETSSGTTGWVAK